MLRNVRFQLRGLILFKNQIQTTSVSPCRTRVQPSASFLVCSLIFIEYKIILSIDLSDSKARTYRILSEKIIVNPNYEVRVKFYCRIDESGQFRGITKLLATSLVNKDGDKEAPFTGNLFAYLEDPNRIFYMVSGEFYHKGSNKEQLYQREGGRMLEVIYDFMDDTSTGFPVFLETKLRF